MRDEFDPLVERVEELETEIGTKAPGSVAQDLTEHTSASQGVHGIADAALLETTAGANSKVATHNAETTNVHGIPNTAQLATTAYVDAAAAGATTFDPVRVATTANVNLGTGTLLTVDGVTVVADNRVLVKSQTNKAENGIYLAKTGAWVRAMDLNTDGELINGSSVYVQEGTANGQREWRLTISGTPTLGTTEQTWYSPGGAAIPSNAAAGTPSLRTIDGSAGSALPYNHASVTNARPSVQYGELQTPTKVTNQTLKRVLWAYTLAANEWVRGDALVIEAFGTWQNATVGDVAITPSLNAAGSEFTGAAGTLPTSTSIHPWSQTTRVAVDETGKLRVNTTLDMQTPNGVKTWAGDDVITVDLAADNTISFAVQLGTASAVATINFDSAFARKIGNGVVKSTTPLFLTDYDAVDPNSDVTPPWQGEQEPSVGGVEQDRITIVSPGSVPGTGTYKPLGAAMRVELRSYNGGAGDAITTTNRAEVYARQADPTSTPAANWADPVGSERWYGWGIYVPSDFATVTDPSTWMTVTHWPGLNVAGSQLAIDVKQNFWRIGGTAGGSGLIPNDGFIANLPSGAWCQFVVGIKWSIDPNVGWIRVFYNGTEVIPRTSVATMKTSSGNPDPIYFKQGINRSTAWTTTNILHFGPAVIALTRDAVATALGGLYA